ncbi:MAG: 3-oxoacyl-[acyl-carrier-protein] synthase III C-terminal domain-containing protein [Nanoarchaeota archaeon]
MKSFGFKNCYILEDEKIEELLIASAKKMLNAENKKDISLLINCQGINANEYPKKGLSIFKYKAPQLAEILGISSSSSFTLSEQGCGGLLSSINIGREHLASSNSKSVLILAGDCLPKNNNREIMYNVISDAGCGVLLEKNSKKNRILGFKQLSYPYYWDTPKREQELIAAYFTSSKLLIEQTLKDLSIKIEDVDWFVPHNVSKRSWQMLCSITGIPEKKLWMGNIGRVGHTISCDHIINISDMERKNAIKKGDILFLFTFGFGANWTAMVIEH